MKISVYNFQFFSIEPAYISDRIKERIYASNINMDSFCLKPKWMQEEDYEVLTAHLNKNSIVFENVSDHDYQSFFKKLGAYVLDLEATFSLLNLKSISQQGLFALIEFLFSEALIALLNGEKNKSISLLQVIVKKDTNHIRAYLTLGDILRNENIDQAIKIHQSLTVRPNLLPDQKVEIHKALAKDYLEIGYTKNAIEEAKKILLIEKRNLCSLKFMI